MGNRIYLIIIALSIFSSCSESDNPLEPIENEYTIDGVKFEIRSDMYWFDQGVGQVDEIRLQEPLPGDEKADLIVLSPNNGPSSIEGTYVFSLTKDIGTYDLVFVHNTDGDSYNWLTHGESGAELKISVVGQANGQNIYRVLIDNFTLNYGKWDYLSGKWVSAGTKQFSLSYEGPILDD